MSPMSPMPYATLGAVPMTTMQPNLVVSDIWHRTHRIHRDYRRHCYAYESYESYDQLHS
jgi:hypothetical protein